MKHVLLAATSLLLATTPGLSMESFSQFTWKNRVLVLFGAENDQKLRDQLAVIRAQKTELADRDMVVLHVNGKAVETVFGKAGKLDAQKMVAGTGASPSSFTAILIGKDGGVKLRSEEVVPAVELFDLIDRMPMRQSERR